VPWLRQLVISFLPWLSMFDRLEHDGICGEQAGTFSVRVKHPLPILIPLTALHLLNIIMDAI
jgi:hypothetical protein